MDGSFETWTAPARQAAWWQRRIEPKRGAILMAAVAVAAFAAILALDAAGVRLAPGAAVTLSSAGEG